jgi:hypothetical protein
MFDRHKSQTVILEGKFDCHTFRKVRMSYFQSSQTFKLPRKSYCQTVMKFRRLDCQESQTVILSGKSDCQTARKVRLSYCQESQNVILSGKSDCQTARKVRLSYQEINIFRLKESQTVRQEERQIAEVVGRFNLARRKITALLQPAFFATSLNTVLNPNKQSL